MLKIAYDMTALAESPHGGVARVSYHSALQAAAHPSVEPIGYFRKGVRDNIGINDISIVKHRPYHQMLSPWYDIAHSLCHRKLQVRASRHVYTVHDAWSLEPNDYQDAAFQKKVGERLRREIEAADHVVTISETTRNHLLKAGLVQPENCTVTYLGYSPPETETDGKAFPRPPTPYVLYVGCLEMRKNISHLLDAVRPLSDVHLVIAGQPGYGYEEEIKGELEAFPHDRIHLLKTVTRGDLPRLYRNAVATLLPSWEEGFGLPILEAMANSCPIITSNRSANAEIGGDAAILIDPNIPEQSHRAIEKLRDDNDYRKTVVRAGENRSRLFTWEKYFDSLMVVYERVLQP
jgi:glycosyltransferase involved in cell wall biosynthesis